MEQQSAPMEQQPTPVEQQLTLSLQALQAALLGIQQQQQQVQQLQQQLQSQPQHGGDNRQKVKIAKPDTFSDSRKEAKAEEWLFQVEQYFKLINENKEEVKVQYAASLLRGAAATWWRSQTQGQDSQLCTWEEFKQGLISIFTPINGEQLARDRLANLRQTNTVSGYLQRFRVLCLQIPDITDKEKKDRFIRGLKRYPGVEVAIRQPASFEDAAKLAATIEQAATTYQQGSFYNHQPAPSYGPQPMEIGAMDQRKSTLRPHTFKGGAAGPSSSWRQSGPPRPYQGPASRFPSGPKYCNNCKRRGHWTRDCYSQGNGQRAQ
jgi:Retrotransposon gag protein